MNRPSPARILQSLGPGVVFALTVLGPGDLVANAVTGATHGYVLLWALLLSLGFRFVWLDTSARYVMATGESLMEGYLRFGPWLSYPLLAAMFVVRLLANLYKIILLTGAFTLFFPAHPPLLRFAIAALVSTIAFLICDRGGYAALEKVCKLLIALMCGGLLMATILARPDPAAILSGIFIPSLPEARGAYSTVFILLALVGTEAGSLTNITYTYFLRERGWRGPAFQFRQRLDLLLSVSCLFLISAATQVAAAAALLPAGLSPSNASDLVRVFTHALGQPGLIIFSFGICAAAFSGLIGATTGYALVARDIIPKLPNSRLSALPATTVYRGAVAIWCFAPLLLMAWSVQPVFLVLLVSALMAACIPVLAIFLLLLASNRTRMGSLAIGPPTQAALIVLTLASTALLAVQFVEWLKGSGWL